MKARVELALRWIYRILMKHTDNTKDIALGKRQKRNILERVEGLNCGKAGLHAGRAAEA